MCGKVHHGINIVCRKYLFQQFCVSRVTHDKLACRDGSVETCREIVERNDAFARSAELADDMAADVTGATGDQYLAVFHNFLFLSSIGNKEM
jgi:hypothetical protein